MMNYCNNNRNNSLMSKSLEDDDFKKRKQRKIYNAYTDIDSVAEPPGPAFRNWIITTKKKLQEREVNLLSIRMDVIKTAIYDTVQEFNNNPINTKLNISVNMKCIEEIFKIINYDLISISIDCLKVILSDWNGIDLTRSTKKFTNFRKYFVVSKNWFDQRKKGIVAQHFWLTILNAIKQFSINAAKECFGATSTINEYQYTQCLLLKLIFAIFGSKTQFSSTKPQPLIPGGTIKDTNDIKQFLETRVDSSLSMIKLIKDNGLNSEQETSATQTLQFILKQLKVLNEKFDNAFHSNLTQNNCNSNLGHGLHKFKNVNYGGKDVTFNQQSISSDLLNGGNGNLHQQYNDSNDSSNLSHNSSSSNVTPNIASLYCQSPAKMEKVETNTFPSMLTMNPLNGLYSNNHDINNNNNNNNVNNHNHGIPGFNNNHSNTVSLSNASTPNNSNSNGCDNTNCNCPYQNIVNGMNNINATKNNCSSTMNNNGNNDQFRISNPFAPNINNNIGNGMNNINIGNVTGQNISNMATLDMNQNGFGMEMNNSLIQNRFNRMNNMNNMNNATMIQTNFNNNCNMNSFSNNTDNLMMNGNGNNMNNVEFSSSIDYSNVNNCNIHSGYNSNYNISSSCNNQNICAQTSTPNGYGPVHRSSVNVSEIRHNPIVHYQSNHHNNSGNCCNNNCCSYNPSKTISTPSQCNIFL